VSGELERLTTTFVVPLTAEIVELGDPVQAAKALDTVRRFKRDLDEARVVLEDALRVASERAGSRTLHLDDMTVVVSGGDKVEYDVLELASRLRAAGLPEQRLTELVVETVTYRVDQRVARSVEASSPRYAAVLERCRRTVPAPWRVAIKRGGAR
jgi:hypothetical protein